MSLMKKRTMSEARKAASRANGRRSRGPATREGRERIRAANLRHGLYSQAEEVVLPALGEDAAEFEEFRQGIYASWPLVGASQESLIEDLTVAMWRLKRIDRRREELEIEQARALFEAGADADFDAARFLRVSKLESASYGEIMRISNLLLKAEQPKHIVIGRDIPRTY
jgi:hypothetical protein